MSKHVLRDNMTLRAFAVALLALFLGACQYSPGLADRTLAYNEAVAESTNSLLLLNTLRARDRLPTYYTRSTGDTTTSTISPTLSFGFPFGAKLSRPGANTFNAGVAASEGSQLALQNLDDQKFMRGVLTPVRADVLGFYLRQGWPAEILFMVTVSKITVTESALRSLDAAFESRCATDPSNDYCSEVLPEARDAPSDIAISPSGEFVPRIVEGCAASKYVQKIARQNGSSFVFENYPTNRNQLACFQAMLRVLIALGPEDKSVESLELVVKNLPRARDFSPADVAELDRSQLVLANARGGFAVCRKVKSSGLFLSKVPSALAEQLSPPRTGAQPEGDAVLLGVASRASKKDCTELADATKEAPNDNARIDLITRSFDGMIYYLGEVLRAERPVSEGGRGIETHVWAWNSKAQRFEPWTLYEARAGGLFAHGIVSVDFEGTNYSIGNACSDPETCTDSDGRHRSLQVLALLNQIWGLQKEETSLPLVPTVTVVNP